MPSKVLKYTYITMLCLLLLPSCKLTKYVPEDQYLLNKVTIKSDVPDIPAITLNDYLHQKPNNTVFGFWHLKLDLYNLSNDDSTKWVNRWLRRIGEPPVVYDSLKTEYSSDQFSKFLFNKGYFNADVSTYTTTKKQKLNLTYVVKGNQPYRLNNYITTLPDSAASEIIHANTTNRPKAGILFDTDVLNEERNRISQQLRNRGYYNFQKELLQYTVDTTLGTYQVDAELSLQPQYLENDSALNIIFTKKHIGNITIIILRDPNVTNINQLNLDTTYKRGYRIIQDSENKIFRPSAIINKIQFSPGDLYREFMIEQTYTRLTTLNAVKYVDISFHESLNDSLNATILVSQEKPHTISGEFEFTFSGGDIGAQVGVGYKNNNIFKGSELLSINVKGGYEGMGKITDIQSAWNVGGDISLTFPKLLLPTTKDYRRRTTGTSEVSVSFNRQDRPEYTRIISNAGLKYNWRWWRTYFTYNLVDISYIYLPRMSDEFKDKYMGPSSSIRFSYEDHFIMRMGFSVNHTNRRSNQPLRDYYTLRANLITSGNLLYGLSYLFNQKKNEDGAFEIFNIRYAQYVKADIDYSFNHNITDKHKLVFHTALGVGIPYGNATILPFEERYYSGGSNSMRGWTARTLGPGNFSNTSGSIDFMRQSGDIKFDINLEARFKLFWKLEAAVFTDAGNIWTIRDYPEQPTGQFRWNRFYTQIGWNYGAGLRLDFSFFVIRLDLGIKLYDPGYPVESERWRTELTWKNDFALHFAVGYPF